MKNSVKTLFLSFTLFLGAFQAYAQQQKGMITHDLATYDKLKKAGLQPVFIPTGKSAKDTLAYVLQSSKMGNPLPSSTGCNCTLPLDNTYQVVPFVGAQGPDYRCDDLSSPQINLPFSFCFYGQNFSTCFINNNGNVSFGTAYGTFSSSPFPSNQYVMVAPFWADVDTRGALSGLVYYKVTPTALIVKWDQVGYYGIHDDKLSTFQLILTNSADPLVPNGNNVSMCYGDMQWTTGDASSGTNGFNNGNPNAAPATVGANLGNGIDYVQFGRFGQPGSSYTGPNPSGPNYNGVDWLDNQQLIFNACSNNIPPVPSGIVGCDTIIMCEGDTVLFNINFASPEVNQVTTANATSPGLLGFTITSNNPGNSANIQAQLIGNPANAGYNTITFCATDNGAPPMTTCVPIVVFIDTFSAPPPVISGNAFYCTGTNGVTLTCNNAGYTSFLWSTGATTQSINNATQGVYTCTVGYNGCYKTDTFTVALFTSPVPVITGQLSACGSTPAHLDATDPGFVSYLWSNGDTTSNVFVMSGNYTVTVTDTNGCTGTSASVTVAIDPVPVAAFSFVPTPTSYIGNVTTFTDQSTVSSGTITTWNWNFGDGSGTSNLQNPTYYYTTEGTFTITLVVTTAAGCSDTATMIVKVESGYTFYVPSAFTPNNDTHNDVFIPEFSAIDVGSFEMWIFDRWGQKIFYSTDAKNGWLGKVNNSGSLVQEDVYEYLFKFKDLGGLAHSVVGHVSVIR